MQLVADLHLHSKYSRAVSKDMVLPIMAAWGAKKGIDILSASDWTHGLWFKEIRSQLEEKSEGLYKLKKTIDGPLFLLSTEISSIYSQGGKVRRIHNLVFAPNFEIAEKINKELVRRGCNLLSDGRPIIGISSKDLLEIVLAIDPRVLLIPCHVWTPHFGIYGSASGFDSIDEAFRELAPYIYGIETGLSSDPEMNWQIAELKNRSILSFSDAHSPAKMGREATVFVSKNGISNQQITYQDITQAIKRDTSGRLKIGYTIEFYPEEGKYHFSGHRNCGIVRGPEETRKEGDICPKCKRRLTEGVLYRVQQLSNNGVVDRVEKKRSPHGIQWYTDTTKNQPPYVKLVPLLEIIAEALDSTVSSQKVRAIFENLCEVFISEIEVLLKIPIEQIEKVSGPKVADGIAKVRGGDIVIEPGYDGEYGKVKIWAEGKDVAEDVDEQQSQESQLGLF